MKISNADEYRQSLLMSTNQFVTAPEVAPEKIHFALELLVVASAAIHYNRMSGQVEFSPPVSKNSFSLRECSRNPEDLWATNAFEKRYARPSWASLFKEVGRDLGLLRRTFTPCLAAIERSPCGRTLCTREQSGDHLRARDFVRW